MRDERTAKDVIQELIDKATTLNCVWMIRSDIRGRDDPKIFKENAENIGKLVQKLPESDRELIKNLTAEELISYGWYFGGYDRRRPKEKVSTRIRGPVSFTKREEDGK